MKITFILKRDGRKQKYDRGKIAMATWQSLWAVSQVKRKFPQITDIDEIARRAAEVEVPHQKADRKSPLWKEAERLAKIVEDTLIRSNLPRRQAGGSHLWKVEEIQDIREQTLMAAGREAEAKAYIFYRNRKTSARQTRQESDLLKPSSPAFLNMSDNAYAAMAKRYLWKDKDGNVIETPKQAMERVATAVAVSESLYPSSRATKWRGDLVGIAASSRRDVGTPRNDARNHWRDRYLEIMTSFEFVPAGCYFRGAGNKQNGSLANCFVLPVEDSIEKIFDAVKWAALIHQMGGGVGYNFSHLRPRGDAIKSGGLASGPINFMKAFDAETQVVMQGGQHRGANMGILNVDHPDVFEFIRAKSIDGEVSNFNISVGAFDKFMRAVERGSDWQLVNPRDKLTVQNIPSRQLWQEIISLAHRTGDPGMIYLDTINKFNPIMKALGPIEATNVCGEQPLHPFDCCNLGSINLAKFVIKPFWENFGKLGKLRKPGNQTIRVSEDQNLRLSDSPNLRQSGPPSIQSFLENIKWERLEEVVRAAVRFLDNGIDASTYPIPQIEEMAHKLRRIGLGVMGWADMLVKLGVSYDSYEGVKLAESIMKFIQQISWDESEKLAKQKAAFPLWEESYFNSKNNLFGKNRKVRNVAVTTIAPTGTISMIADCSSGIEPYFALEYTKNVVEKEGLKYTNQYYAAAQRVLSEHSENSENRKFRKSAGQKSGNSGFPALRSSDSSGPPSIQSFLKNIFRTAHEISPEWHVKMQAAFQKYTDNAVSKTINFPQNATVKDVESAYLLAWKIGCKGITVYRDGSREGQILKEEGRRKKEEGRTNSDSNTLTPYSLLPTPKLMQSQMTITPLSQRAYKYERQQIIEESVDGHCPECGSPVEETEGCSLCRNCGFSKCSI